MLLSLGTCVCFMAFLIKSPLVDDTKGTVVVMPGVNALDSLWQQWYDFTITLDVIMVAALTEPGYAGGYQVIDAERAVASVAYTMDDDEFY